MSGSVGLMKLLAVLAILAWCAGLALILDHGFRRPPQVRFLASVLGWFAWPFAFKAAVVWFLA